MKRWFAHCAFGLSILVGSLLIITTGYLAGWKTGAAAAVASPKPGLGEPATDNRSRLTARPDVSFGRTETNSASAGAGSFSDALNSAWRAYRFAPDRDLAAARLWELINSLDAEELSEAFSLACKLPGGETRKNAIWMVLRQWAETDPAGAIEGCARQFKQWERLDYMGTLIGIISSGDPVAGYQAYRRHLAHLDGASHDSAVFPLSQVFPSWLKRDFGSAWAEFEKLTAREKKYALRGMTRLLHENSETGNKLLSLLNESGDPALVETARLEVARGLGRKGDAESAQEWLNQQQLPVETRIQLEDTIAQRWALENPRAAADWLAAQMRPEDSSARLRDVIQRWADWEVAACAEWIDDQVQQGRNMDRAIDAYARNIGFKDPAAAVSWTARIADPRQRHQTAEFLGESFRRQMISNGQELIRNSNLGESEKRAALKKLVE